MSSHIRFRPALAGQIYLDIVIALGLLAILGHAIATLVYLSYELLSFTRARVTAKLVGQEVLEVVRNLPYQEVGTVGGIPNGPLPQLDTITRNGLAYAVKTSVIYFDDPFDGLAPDDLLPTDYKRVRIDVSWGGLGASGINPVTYLTDIAPSGVETITGGGTLSILVFNAYGEPVPQTQVNLTAQTLNPPVDLSLQTDDHGRVILPGAPTCLNCYQIAVSKSGFSSERTYDPAEVANPNKPPQTVLEGQLTEVSFAIDKTSSLTLISTLDREAEFAPAPHTQLQVRGEKTIGTDINDEPVFKYTNEVTTDDNGRAVLDNLEWDNYAIFLPSSGGWMLAGMQPLLPFSLLPDQDQTLFLAIAPKTTHSLLTIFTDSASNPVASVSAALKLNLTTIATGTSGLANQPDHGQLLFPDLNSLIYQLEATLSGFLPVSQSINVSGQKQETVIMTPE